MPTRRQTLSIFLTAAALVALAVSATDLKDLEVTAGDSLVSATDTAGVTVAWVTDYDPLLGGQSVVGATLVPTEGTILDDSSIVLTIVDAEGATLGTISSVDGGQTWSGPRQPVAAQDSLAASLVIDDRVTSAAVSAQ